MMDRSIRMMLRTRINDRPGMIRDVIRRTAKVKDIEELMREYEALETLWVPPARFADVMNPAQSRVAVS
jgi:hypothetical protein